MTIYSCDLCKKVFIKKIDLTKHQNKKMPCIKITDMQRIGQIKEVQYYERINLKSLGEVCDINKGNPLAKIEMSDSIYVGVDSKNIIGNHNQKNSDGIDFTLTRVGNINVNYTDKPYYLTNNGFSLKSKQEDIVTKYIYYMLSHNTDYLKNLYQGTAKKVISKTKLKSIKIPIPSLEHQLEIIKYLDFIYGKANKTNNERIADLKQLNEFRLNNQKLFGENVIKTLGEVCKVNKGTYIKPSMKINGEYPVYGSGIVSYYINQYNREDDIIIAKDDISEVCVRYETNKFFLNHRCWTLICKEQIIKKYLFYYLQSIQPKLLNIANGTIRHGINQESFYKLKIYVPSLECQKKL